MEPCDACNETGVCPYCVGGFKIWERGGATYKSACNVCKQNLKCIVCNGTGKRHATVYRFPGPRRRRYPIR